MPLPVLDTNILIRHFTQDHPDHSPKATRYLRRIEQGELRARLPLIVVFETVYTLQSFYKLPKDQIRALLLSILSLPGIILIGKRCFRKVFDYYVTLNISLPDAYIAVEMEQLHDTRVVSFDRNFDKISGIERIEPS